MVNLRARGDCLEPNFASLVVIEFPVCTPRLSSNGIHLLESLKVDCGVLQKGFVAPGVQ